MTVYEKLSILTDAAKYDVACTSSGSSRGAGGSVGSARASGICHTSVSYTHLSEGIEKAYQIVKTIVEDPEVGAIYKGVVTRLMNFGAFVEIAPGKEGLVHISKLDDKRVAKVEDVVNVGDEILVMVTEIDDQNRINPAVSYTHLDVYKRQGCCRRRRHHATDYRVNQPC